MKQYYAAEIVTSDNLIHQGIYHEPVKKSDTAILWIHGLTSNFYSDVQLFEQMTIAGDAHGIGFASFNTRGHDMIAGISTADITKQSGHGHVNGGAGYERFEDCVYDIDAGITFLKSRGFDHIILVGHSTGANKVCYYEGTKHDPRVSGVALVSPISDRLGEEKTNPGLADTVEMMEKRIAGGLGDTLVNDVLFFPITPRRYVCLFGKNSEEDVFDYGDKKPKLTLFQNIIKPRVFVAFGALDEYADRPVSDIKTVFDQYANTANYTSILIPGAPHGFDGKEKEFADALISWITQ